MCVATGQMSDVTKNTFVILQWVESLAHKKPAKSLTDCG